MIITARLNSDDTKIYHLTVWDSQDFANSTTLKVMGNDLQRVSTDFSEITKLEVFQDDNLVAMYTGFDSFSEISYLRNEYCPGESRFVDAFRIRLTKADIIEQINRLDNQINPVVDIAHMTLEETKEYKIKELGDICRAEIYAGQEVTLPNGVTELYTYNQDDQANILSATTLAFAAKTMGFHLDYIPYHASNRICRLLDTTSMVTIYMTLQLMLTRLTTKCNLLNCMIRESNDKDEVLDINWNTPLPTEYQQRFDEIMTTAVEIAQEMARAMAPETPEDEDEQEEPEIPDDPEESGEPED